MTITDDEKRTALIALTKSAGWEILLGIAREQIERRSQQIIYQPLSESWTSEMQEYAKGECQGMLTLMKIPEVFIEHHEPEAEEIENAE